MDSKPENPGMAGEPSIAAADFFLLRIPALPKSFKEELRRAFHDRTAFDALLRQYDSQLREAIFLASSSLYDSVFGKEMASRAADLSLMRYLYRMTSRCTPYGTFAAVGLGRVDADHSLRVTSPGSARRVVRLDQAAVGAVQSALFRAPSLDVARRCRIRINESAWRAPDGWRYVEAKRSPTWNHYELARIGDSQPIELLYGLLANEPMEFGDAAAGLSARLSLPLGDIEAFLLNLIREQFVFAGPRVAVTSDDPLRDFVSQLQTLELVSPVAAAIVSAEGIASKVNNSSEPLSVDKLSEIHEKFESSGMTSDRSKLVQVDLHLRDSPISMAQEFVDRVIATVDRLRPILIRAVHNMGDFAERFERQYGSRHVPLLEAIDDDFGIGFGRPSKVRTPLVDGIVVSPQAERNVTLREFDDFLLDRFTRIARSGDSSLILQPDDLDKLPKSARRLQSSATILGSAFRDADGQMAFDLSGIFGPPSGMLLGRFGVGNKEIADALRTFQATAHGHADIIFAEIAHLPEGRVGNVVIRPVLSDYEISYLGSGSAEGNRTLLPKDLDVSCVDGHIALWRRACGTRVMPRMSNAHNFDNYLNLPVYRFLASVARQGQPITGWSWGGALATAPWKPEVRFDCIRLARESWRLTPPELKRLEGEGFAGIARLQDERRIPDQIRVVEGDNFLEVDLAHKLDRELFIDACKRRQVVEIERAPAENAIVIDSEGNRYANEIAIPFRTTGSAPSLAHRSLASQEGRQNATPGSQWVYLKIFCGGSVADSLVSSLFLDWAIQSFAKGFGKAFFIRYAEGGHHLRLRFCAPNRAAAKWFRELAEEGLETRVQGGVVSRYEYATYQPEFDRYGGADELDMYERIFTLDSLATAKTIKWMERRPDREDVRWKFALDSMVRLALAGANGNRDHALKCLEALRDGYLIEFRQDIPNLDKVARKFRPTVWKMLTKELGETWDGTLQERDVAIAALLGESQAEAEPKPVIPISIMTSLLHMCANRIFRENARLHELAISHIAIKTLRSIDAKEKHRRDEPISVVA